MKKYGKGVKIAKLESIEYIEHKKIDDFNSESISDFLTELQELTWQDFGSSNRKIGKMLLYLRYPAYRDIIAENTNSLDFNIFTLTDILVKIYTAGYGYIFCGKWDKQGVL